MSLESEQLVGGESDRIRLARVALAAALGVPGVLGADAGSLGTVMTRTSAGERLDGVSCVAAASGGYDVSLRLVCGLVALHPLGERIRAKVLSMAATAVVGVSVRSVDVYFADINSTGAW